MSRIDLLKGTLDLLVHNTLPKGPMHGYAVARWIQRTTDDALQLAEETRYPALCRMERKGCIASTWGVSGNNRRARCYRLTGAGRKHLDAEARAWVGISEASAKIMGTA